MKIRRYVRPSNNGWYVLEPGHRRGTVKAATKKEAIAKARRQVGAHGGEVRVMDKHGKMTDARMVPSAKSATLRRNGGSVGG